jgi:hypothetical protein
MKRCPKCRRLFKESTQKFCRTDGTLLVTGSLNEADTILLPLAPIPYSPTRLFSESTSSIAVLPFKNLTANPANEFLCVGLAEEIVQALSRIENLRVVAPTTAVALWGKTTQDVGKSLNVAMLLE